MYFEGPKTFQDLSNFRKVVLDLVAIQETKKFIEKYFEGSKIFQELSNLKKYIFDLLAIQETFKNQRNIF